MATKLGAMAVGSTVKIKVDGTLRDFIIVQQGNPDSTIYDSSCDGTWVLMKGLYTRAMFGRYNNSYNGSIIQSYLNDTFYSLIDADIRNAIKQAKIPYQNGTGSGGSLATGSNGLSTKVFLLSGYEVGWTVMDNKSFPKDGRRLAYFPSSSDGNSKRIAYNGSSADTWWMRSPYTYSDENIAVVNTNGTYTYGSYKSNYYVRPAFILPSTLVASNDGTVYVNRAPTINADSVDLGEKNAPFDFNYTVTDADGDLMTVTEKLDGEVKAVKTDVGGTVVKVQTALNDEEAVPAWDTYPAKFEFFMPLTAKKATTDTLTVDWLNEKEGYQQVLNGAHTLTIEASDGVLTSTKDITFTKNVTGAKVSLTAPLTADDTITVAALTLEGSFPADMSLTVEMTNNGLDNVPVWENCTDIQSGESRAFVHHAFTNKTATKGAAFNYKVTITRGESGVGGTITMIGGVIG